MGSESRYLASAPAVRADQEQAEASPPGCGGRGPASLGVQESGFPAGSARESAQFAVGSNDAMAGNKQWHRIGSASGADGATGVRAADLAGNLAVAAGLAAGDFAQGLPHLPLKGGPAGEIHGREGTGRAPG